MTGLVGKLFGRKTVDDPEPAGLARLDYDSTPEMWAATTSEFAAPLQGDDADVAVLRPLLARTQLERRPLRLCYDSDVQGFDAALFHRGVDAFGASIVLCETTDGDRAGGYNPRGWVGLGEDRDAIAAFLFALPRGGGEAVKLPKTGGASLAVVEDRPDRGPAFGPEGLRCLLDANDGMGGRRATSRLGSYYERMPGGCKSLFQPPASGRASRGGGVVAEMARLRAWVAEGDGEEWVLDGIVWKTKC